MEFRITGRSMGYKETIDAADGISLAVLEDGGDAIPMGFIEKDDPASNTPFPVTFHVPAELKAKCDRAGIDLGSGRKLTLTVRGHWFMQYGQNSNAFGRVTYDKKRKFHTLRLRLQDIESAEVPPAKIGGASATGANEAEARTSGKK